MRPVSTEPAECCKQVPRLTKEKFIGRGAYYRIQCNRCGKVRSNKDYYTLLLEWDRENKR